LECFTANAKRMTGSRIMQNSANQIYSPATVHA
jgi:hypothetical protein